MAPDVEHEVAKLIPDGGSAAVPVDPRGTQSLAHRVANALREVPAGAQAVVLCSSSPVRALLRRLTQTVLPTVPILSSLEIPDGVKVQAVGQVR